MLGSGTAEFVASCLAGLGLPAVGIERWTVRPVRQSYYSDYPHSSDWRARWDVAWQCEVWLSKGVEFKNVVRPYPVEVGAIDASATDDEPATSAGTALVIGFSPPGAPASEAVEDLVTEWARRHGFTTRTKVNVNRFDDGYGQTRIVVDDAGFPADLEALATLNSRIRSTGSLTTWRALAAARSRQASGET
jgi:hypothetical protein